MKILVDTHVLIWALTDDRRLSVTAKRILTSEESVLFYSMVSLWEASIKMSLGKLRELGSSVLYLRDEMKAYKMEVLPVRFEHVLQLERLPLHHRDPFDRLLVAQALNEGMPMLTGDKRLRDYPVETIW